MAMRSSQKNIVTEFRWKQTNKQKMINNPCVKISIMAKKKMRSKHDMDIDKQLRHLHGLQK